MNKQIFLLLLISSIILQGCFCFCDKTQLAEYEFDNYRTSVLSEYTKEKYDSNYLGFDLELFDERYYLNQTTDEHITYAGLMQPCECQAVNLPEFQITDIQLFTLSDLSMGFTSGANITNLTKVKFGYQEGLSSVKSIIPQTQKYEFSTQGRYNITTLRFLFLIEQKPVKGLHQFRVVFTFRNGNTLEALSPEIEFS